MAHTLILCVDPDTQYLQSVKEWLVNLPDARDQPLHVLLAVDVQQAQQELDANGSSDAVPRVLIMNENTPGIPPAELADRLLIRNPFLQLIRISDDETAMARDQASSLSYAPFRVPRNADQPILTETVKQALDLAHAYEQEQADVRPWNRLSDTLRALSDLLQFNSYHNSLLSTCLKHTNAQLAILFAKSGDSSRIQALMAQEMDQDMALQAELQENPHELSQQYSRFLQGTFANTTHRMTFPLDVNGSLAGYLLLEKSPGQQGFRPVEQTSGQIIAAFAAKQEGLRKLQHRTEQDKKYIEAMQAELRSLKQVSTLQHQSLDQTTRYARLVTESLVRPEEDVTKLYEDSFILRRLRSEVSGSFYWFHERFYKFMLGLGDTRVSGMGGGFLTILFHKLMNELVDRSALPKPRSLLLQLHDYLVANQDLKSTNSLSGFRMGLISIDDSVQVLRYAGADFPLFLVRDGKVNRIDSGGVPLGSDTYDGSGYDIKQHTLQLNAGDRAYLTTTGLLELRGGPDNEPFGMERFKHLLHEVHEVPFKEVHEVLQVHLHEWVGERPLSADVVLAGIGISELGGRDDLPPTTWRDPLGR